ncbi:MAG TPA: MraY family glycosyltransferase [Longimicrobiaceae bacterium]
MTLPLPAPLAIPSGYWVVLAVAALAGVLVTPLVIRAAVSLGIYDAPGGRRVHTTPIPRLGGVAICAATALGLGLSLFLEVTGWGDFRIGVGPGKTEFFVGLLCGGAILFVAGLVDDLRHIRPLAKLLAQILAAVVIYWFGFRVEGVSLAGRPEIELGWLSLPLTVLWVVGVTNAFNLIDGLDGLATGVALVALGTTLAMAFKQGTTEVQVVCVTLIGALLGFLRYNFNPARIFLGDSGSLMVGFMLAALSVHGSQKSATAALALVPLFALALPLLDTSLAMLRRWLRGVPLSEGDARHIHHQLLAAGLTHRRAVFVLYAVALAVAMLGLSIALAPPAAAVVISVTGGAASVLILMFGVRRLQYHEFSEAGQVLVSGALRVRRVIGDQIHARDVAQVIRRAETLQQIDAILEDNAPNFRFLHMEICREGDGGRSRFNAHAARAWKLDYPVNTGDADHDPYVLRIWCHPGDGFRPFGAERVAHILAPVIEERLVAAVEGKRPVVRLRAEIAATPVDLQQAVR